MPPDPPIGPGMSLRVLLAVPRWDYGRPEQGDSYEVMAFLQPFRDLGHDVVLHDTLDPAADLEQAVADHRPDLTLFMLGGDEVRVEALRAIRPRTTTVNWFADDAWRFRHWSRHLAPEFDLAVTTSRAAEAGYRDVPGARAVFLPWGFNPCVFHPVPDAERFDVAFVGQRYGARGRAVEALQADGIDVRAWGAGWPNGRLATDDLAAVFSGARISLNFLDSSPGPFRRRHVRFKGSDRLDRALLPLFPPPRQLKARLVEIPACGSLQITNGAPELGELLAIGDEVVVAEGAAELRRLVRHHLEHDDERAAAAAAGHRRAVADHSYRTRLPQLLDAAGLA